MKLFKFRFYIATCGLPDKQQHDLNFDKIDIIGQLYGQTVDETNDMFDSCIIAMEKEELTLEHMQQITKEWLIPSFKDLFIDSKKYNTNQEHALALTGSRLDIKANRFTLFSTQALNPEEHELRSLINACINELNQNLSLLENRLDEVATTLGLTSAC